MKVGPATSLRDIADTAGVLVDLSGAGGLTQFGAWLDTLMPGATSSDRHWHTVEDEFLYMLQGQATLIDDKGAQTLGPGDVACWPNGCPNAHHLVNRGTAACTFLIVGTRVAHDICHYPDSGRQQVNGKTAWQIIDAAGAVRDGGDLPPHLLHLPGVWGKPFDPATPGLRVQPAANRSWTSENGYVHPMLGGGLGAYRYQLLSDPGGLSQFGAFVEELPPGAQSSFRHWHANEDEMVLILSGTATLIEDHETTLAPGDVACWPAGTPTAHCLANRTSALLRYIVIGTRHQTDVIHYPDHDLITHKDGPARRYLRSDGSPFETTAGRP
jgi:uncharacterized cupin superfamily protein